jgi:2-C-methyl-D-erythritol 2,4-cyclodiphosphate synthase
MLERFTEKARRVIFFARYEASQYGSPCIEADHLLLGLVREDPRLASQLGLTIANIRETIEARITIKERISTSIEVPLTKESKNILNRAAEEADKLGHRHVGPEHLLLAIIVESPQIRSDLEKLGLKESDLRAYITKQAGSRTPEPDIAGAGYYGAPQPLRLRTTRSGIGYDLHRLEPGRKLIVGGVEIPFDKGPVGHSDGDVLAHAICDAVLGAAGLGDIGTHFPDTDPKWKGANSLLFLEHLAGLLHEKRFHISHIDAVVILERPKLGPHFPAMREAIAKALGIKTDHINLKAKTNEGVDAVGRGEAIAAHAVATIAG